MGYQCTTCGAWHDERPWCFLAAYPDAVAELTAAEFESRVECSSDQCVLDGERFFILGNLDVPLRGSTEFIRWTVWCALSKADFERATALWRTAGREKESPYLVRLGNEVPGYPPVAGIQGRMHTQPVGVRPSIEIIEAEHRLTLDQKSGIDQHRADALIHAALD